MRALLFILALWCAGFAQAQGVLAVPELTARVIDQTGTLDATQRKSLEDKLAAFETAKGSQIVVLMVATTQPEDITSYANRVANAWKIGRRAVGDGVLLIVARNDRKVRIEVAKTLEGAIPDLAAKQIIDDAITPKFRQQDYAGGLSGAVDQLMGRINGEALPAVAARPAAGQGHMEGFDWTDLAIFALFAIPIGSRILGGILGRKLGALTTGAGVGVIATMLTSSLVVGVLAGVVGLVVGLLSGGASSALPMRSSGLGRRSGRGGGSWGTTGGGWGGGGGSSSDGGGFSSGGGGDFGGGGASGDW